jgi:hypothetical protein
MMGPLKPARSKFVINAEPTEFGLSEAPKTATDCGRNILSRLRIDTGVCSLRPTGNNQDDE